MVECVLTRRRPGSCVHQLLELLSARAVAGSAVTGRDSVLSLHRCSSRKSRRPVHVRFRGTGVGGTAY